MVTSSPPLDITTTLSPSLGSQGEELAAAYLSQLGFQLVAANFTVPVGRNRNDAVVHVEIDLVAYEGPVLCFVEVKTRTSDWFASPAANVDLRKQRQITRGASSISAHVRTRGGPLSIRCGERDPSPCRVGRRRAFAARIKGSRRGS